MSIRERLLEVEDLNIAETLPHMTNQQLDEYIATLNSFVDDFPQLEIELRTTSENKDYDALHNKVLAVSEDLADISADDIAEECRKQANGFKSEKSARFEAYVNYLLSQLASLSIDIQMALFKENEPDKGADPGEEAPAEAELPDEAAAEKFAGKLILAVDDDPQCLDMFKLAMKDVSCKIIAVTSGAAALDVIKTVKSNLFVFDIDMPEMNGLELAKTIRDGGNNTPIVFITGNAEKNIVMKALKAGGSDFIFKPINPQNVIGRISKFI